MTMPTWDHHDDDNEVTSRLWRSPGGSVLLGLEDRNTGEELMTELSPETAAELARAISSAQGERDRHAALKTTDTLLTATAATEVSAAVLNEVATERTRFGEQNHPDLDPRDISFVAHHEYARRAARWKEINTERAQPTITPGRCREHPDEPRSHTAWDGILLEKVYEALAESDPEKLRAELVHVAAVAVAWAQAIDQRAEAPQ